MISPEERWQLFVLFQDAIAKAEAKGKAWAFVDKTGSMESCMNTRQDMIDANKKFREYLDSIVDPIAKATAANKAASDLTKLLAK